MECEQAKDGLVLIGFGSHNLKDMLEWVDTDKEMDLLMAFKKWPPIYRDVRSCEAEDVQTAFEFLKYLNDVVVEYDKHEKENKNEHD
jgi:hypothetical protein